MRGTVIFWDANRGFGTIRNDLDNTEVFVHYTGLCDEEQSTGLLPGERVEYDIVERDQEKGAMAVDVKRSENRRWGTVASFEHGCGLIRPDDAPDELIFVHYTDIESKRPMKTLEADSRVTYEEATYEKGRKAIRVATDDRLPLEKFAYFEDYDTSLASLARLAEEPNDWQYPNNPDRDHPYPILHGYIQYTFKRLQVETQKEGQDKIPEFHAAEGKFACFNTGLVTEMQEGIIALFRDRRAHSLFASKWLFVDFLTESDRRLTCFRKIPDIANYFDDPRDILYDTRMELRLDWVHLRDRLNRIPEPVRAKYDSENELIERIRSATELALKRVKRTYKTAIPQYHNGKLQLLLPLCILSPVKADAALVVSREREVYIGWSILSLDQAYNNSRLIARPDTEWLNP